MGGLSREAPSYSWAHRIWGANSSRTALIGRWIIDQSESSPINSLFGWAQPYSLQLKFNTKSLLYAGLAWQWEFTFKAHCVDYRTCFLSCPNKTRYILIFSTLSLIQKMTSDWEGLRMHVTVADSCWSRWFGEKVRFLWLHHCQSPVSNAKMEKINARYAKEDERLKRLYRLYPRSYTRSPCERCSFLAMKNISTITDYTEV